MKSRTELLLELLTRPESSESIGDALSRLPWDVPEPLVEVDRGAVRGVLRKVLDGEMGEDVLERWANLVEMREDLTVPEDIVKEAILELANPEIQGATPSELAREWYERLGS